MNLQLFNFTNIYLFCFFPIINAICEPNKFLSSCLSNAENSLWIKSLEPIDQQNCRNFLENYKNNSKKEPLWDSREETVTITDYIRDLLSFKEDMLDLNELMYAVSPCWIYSEYLKLFWSDYFNLRKNFKIVSPRNLKSCWTVNNGSVTLIPLRNNAAPGDVLVAVEIVIGINHDEAMYQHFGEYIIQVKQLKAGMKNIIHLSKEIAGCSWQTRKYLILSLNVASIAYWYETSNEELNLEIDITASKTQTDAITDSKVFPFQDILGVVFSFQRNRLRQKENLFSMLLKAIEFN